MHITNPRVDTNFSKVPEVVPVQAKKKWQDFAC